MVPCMGMKLCAAFLAFFSWHQCGALLRLSIAPIQIYNVVGSSGKPFGVHYFLMACQPGESLWRLLHFPTLDFRSYWDATLRFRENHPVLASARIDSRLVHPVALPRLSGWEIWESGSMLDLRYLKDFARAGHPPRYTERLLEKVAFDYGSLYPDGAWCANYRWSSEQVLEMPNVWPLVDIECIAAASPNPHTPSLYIDLVTSSNDWDVLGRHAPDYRMACVRFLIFEHLRIAVLARKDMPQVAKHMRQALGGIRGKIAEIAPSQSRWFSHFCALVSGATIADAVSLELIMLIEGSTDLSLSFRNRLLLLLVSTAWSRVTNTGALLGSFRKAIASKHTNPVHVASTIDVIFSVCPPGAKRLLESVLELCPTPTYASSTHLHYTVWDILLRPLDGQERPPAILSAIPLRIRRAAALKHLRYLDNRAPLGYFSHSLDEIAESLEETRRLTPYGVFPVLVEYNQKCLDSHTSIMGLHGFPKIIFGMQWSPPVRFLDMAFHRVASRAHGCQVLQSVLGSLLYNYGSSNLKVAYQMCHLERTSVCRVYVVGLFLLHFAWGCQLHPDLVPPFSLYQLGFSAVDVMHISTNWLSGVEFYQCITGARSCR